MYIYYDNEGIKEKVKTKNQGIENLRLVSTEEFYNLVADISLYQTDGWLRKTYGENDGCQLP